MKLDVLITTAHPDDAECCMGGTILKLIAQGKKVGICDFTAGELGTRGTSEIRLKEAAEADKRLSLTTRINLGFRDGFFKHDEDHVRKVIEVIREYQPDILFTNPLTDRHPDHGVAGKIANDAAFLSGLPKIETKGFNCWRPKAVFHYIMATQHEPDFIVDITPHWEGKLHAIHAYASQFGSDKRAEGEPETILTDGRFMPYLESRARTLGMHAGATFSEGFIVHQIIKIDDIMGLAR